jgi:nucleoside-diphosphate-sugar epimerase
MRVLLIGGTGLISTGIVKHLLARGADVTMFNRGKRENTLPASVKQIEGDRNEFEKFERRFQTDEKPFDVVMDMIAFNPNQAESDVRAFGGRCQQFIFCSTVCAYGVKVPPGVLVDETFPMEPISGYGRNKLASEQILLRAHEQGKFKTTIIRPSCTYGPGGGLIDNLEFNPPAWDRIEKGLPILCSNGGMGLWVGTHRDDVGKLFAYAALNPKTYGQAYNATRDENFTWRDWYAQAAEGLGAPRPKLIFMTAEWILRHDPTPARFGLLREITQFHGAYSSAKAKRDVPEFKADIDFRTGAAQTLADVKRRGAWKSTEGDAVYQSMVDKVLAAGVEAVEI